MWTILAASLWGVETEWRIKTKRGVVTPFDPSALFSEAPFVVYASEQNKAGTDTGCALRKVALYFC